jgi:competence protein ComGC
MLEIYAIIVLIISIFLIIWIRGLYINSEKIKNLLYVQIRILEKEAELKGLDIEQLYKKADKLTTYSIKRLDKTNF